MLAWCTVWVLAGCGAAGTVRGDQVGARAPEGPDETLDAWHAAAASGDAVAYFGRMTADAVFLGTDDTERWVGDGFRAFAEPYFDGVEAWTYTPIERHVEVRGDVAWFDERLVSASYGPCRGTGVLVREGGGPWRVAHYSLTIPIPNAIAKDVVRQIAAELDRAD